MRNMLSKVGLKLCCSPLHKLPNILFRPLFAFACYLSKL
jgi:hypothetical protein